MLLTYTVHTCFSPSHLHAVLKVFSVHFPQSISAAKEIMSAFLGFHLFHPCVLDYLPFVLSVLRMTLAVCVIAAL